MAMNWAIAIMTVGAAGLTIADFGKSGVDLDRIIERLYPDQSGGAVMLESMTEAASKLSEAPTPRRVIVSLNLEGFPEASTIQPQEVANAILRSHAQLWAMSTAGTSKSVWWRGKLDAGRAAAEMGVSDELACFEWSAPAACSIQ